MYINMLRNTLVREQLIGNILNNEPSIDYESDNIELRKLEMDFFVPCASDNEQAKYDAYKTIKRDLVKKFENSNSWVIDSFTRGARFGEILTDLKEIINKIRTLTPNPNSMRLSSYIWAVIIRWTQEYSLIFAADENSRPIYARTFFFDMYSTVRTVTDDKDGDAAADNTKRAFTHWYATKQKLSAQSAIRNAVELDFSKAEVKNTDLLLPKSFYESMLDLATQTGVNEASEYISWTRQYSEWRDSAVNVAKIRAVSKSQGWDLDISPAYDLLLPHAFDIEITREEAERAIAYHNASCAVVVASWKEFVEECYVTSFEQILPQVTFRRCARERSGIPTIYSFVFDAPYKRTAVGYRFRVKQDPKAGGSKQVALFSDIATISLRPSSGKSTVDPIVLEFLMKQQKGFYGVDLVPENVKAAIVEFMRDDIIRPAGPNKYSYTRYKTAYTLVPPRRADRTTGEDIRVTGSSEIRVADRDDFEQREYSLTAPVRDIDWLDLWFTYRRVELEANANNLAGLYEARRRLLTSERTFGRDVEFLSVPYDEVAIPNHQLMIEFAVDAQQGVYHSAKTLRLLPQGFAEEGEFARFLSRQGRSTRHGMRRFITVRVPVLKSNLKPLYVQDLTPGATIYSSSEKRNGVSRLRIVDEKFAPYGYTSCYTAYLVLDLAHDVMFNSQTKADVIEKGDRVVLNKPVGIDEFEVIRPENDDRYIIRTTDAYRGMGNAASKYFGDVSPYDLCNSGISGDDHLSLWTELGMGVLRDVALQVVSSKVVGRARELVDFAKLAFNLEADAKLLVSGGVAYVSAMGLYAALEIIVKHSDAILKAVKRALELPVEHQSTFIEYPEEVSRTCVSTVRSVYGSDDEGPLKYASTYPGSYYRLLLDSLAGVNRLKAIPEMVSALKVNMDLSCLSYPQALFQAARYFTNVFIQEAIGGSNSGSGGGEPDSPEQRGPDGATPKGKKARQSDDVPPQPELSNSN
jgi:hypothetical protein